MSREEAAGDDKESWRPGAVLAMAIFAAVILLLFWQVAFTAQTFFEGDVRVQHVPFTEFVQQCLKNDELPLWCRHIFAGYPFLAEHQAGVFFPLTLLLLLPIPSFVAYNWMLITTYFALAVFTYLYAREMGISGWGAVAAGLVYALLAAKWIDGPHWYRNLALFPLLLLFVERGIKRHDRKYFVISGIPCGLLWVTGNAQFAFYISLAVTAYIFCRYFSRRGEPGTGNIWASSSLAILICFGLGAALASSQLLPTVELMSLGARAGATGYEHVTAAGIAPQHLITLLYAHINGTAYHYVGPVAFRRTFFAGIISLLLALVAARFMLRRWPTRFYLGLALIALWMAMPVINPLYHLLAYVPGFNAFRAPARWLILFQFSLAMLAGLGLEKLLDSTREVRQWMMWAAALSLALVAAIALGFTVLRGPIIAVGKTLAEKLVYGRPGHVLSLASYYEKVEAFYELLANSLCGVDAFCLMVAAAGLVAVLWIGRRGLSRSIIAALVIGLVVLELFRVATAFTKVTSYDYYRALPRTVKIIKRDPSLYRVGGETLKPYIVNLYEKYQPSGLLYEDNIPNEEVSHRQRDTVMWDTANIFWEVDNLGGFTPLKVAPFRVLASIAGPDTARILGLLNCKYLITQPDLRHPDFEFVDSIPGLAVFRNRRHLPRAFFVGRVRTVGDQQTALEVLASGDFDPGACAVIEGALAAPLVPRAADNSVVELLEWGNNINTVQVSCAQPSFLVVSNVYYPGWQAFVDDQPTEIYKTDVALQGLMVPSGKHTVQLIYYPHTFLVGAWLSLLTVAGVTGYLAFCWPRLGPVPRKLKTNHPSRRGTPGRPQ